MRSSHVVLDAVDVAFDDDHAVASAGLLLPATLAERLGIEQLTDELVDLGGRAASCSRWSTRWPRVVTASMTWSCCGPGRPAVCSATA